MKLTIYTNFELLRYGRPVELLIPFIGLSNAEDSPGKIMSSRFNEFILKGREFIDITNEIAHAHVCLLPIYYRFIDGNNTFENEIRSFIDKVENSNLKTIIFAGHDVYNPTIKIKNSIILNSAISCSERIANMFSWPHFFEDFVKVYFADNLVLKEKEEVPTIGFCGYAPPVALKFGKAKIISSIKLAANYLGIISKFPSKASHSYRARAIIALSKSSKVKTNFHVKSDFAFGPNGQLNSGNPSVSDKDFRKTFVDNIVNSDYTLCVRGIGNNSVRFYETLCCGRIPVFVNTDSVLPFDHIIDWKKLCVWIEEEDIDRVGDLVFDFHRSISNDDFIGLQVKLRRIWEEYFSPLGFFKNLHLILDHPEKS